MSLHFSVLASGSTGNAFYIGTDQTKLLVDAGLSGKKLTSSLEEVGVDPTELDGILVTHEHSDHIKGLGIAARKYDLPIYANEKTWKAMENSIGKITLDSKSSTFQSIPSGKLVTLISKAMVCPMMRSIRCSSSFVTKTTKWR